MPFIVLEGLDGAGKSTQIAMLTELLARRGAAYEYLHFPRFDAPVWGELVARFLRGELGSVEQVNPYLVAMVFAGDRAAAAPMMRRWLGEGRVVLTDRFVHSNIAYQCAKLAGQAEQDELRRWIMELEFGLNELPVPDVSLFLDVPFDFTRDRLAASREGGDRDYLCGARDIHEESLDLQRRVREVYLRSARTDGSLHVVDCSDGHGAMASPGEIFERICGFVEPLLI